MPKTKYPIKFVIKKFVISRATMNAQNLTASKQIFFKKRQINLLTRRHLRVALELAKIVIFLSLFSIT